MLENVVAVTNGKGGVLKTSITANVAGVAAAGGWSVLVVDTDPQGNLARDLGTMDRTDHGAALVDAVMNSAELIPVPVRERLDWIPGGERLEDLVAELNRRALAGRFSTVLTSLEDVLAPLASTYDLILIDTPPGDAMLQRCTAEAARFALVPTAPDEASIDGLNKVAARMIEARQTNPQYDLLGVVLAPVPAGASRVRDETRAKLAAELGEQWPVFESTIRFAQRAAIDCRADGRLAIEYEQVAARMKADVSVAQRIRDRKAGREVKDFSTAAGGLAGDYEALTNEVLAEFARRRDERSEVPA